MYVHNFNGLRRISNPKVTCNNSIFFRVYSETHRSKNNNVAPHEGHANAASIDTSRSQLDAIVITTNPCPAFYRCRAITLRYNVALLDATCKLWLASLLRSAERSIRSLASMTDVPDGCGRSRAWSSRCTDDLAALGLSEKETYFS